MTTPLDKTLKRALVIDNVDYVITLSPQALKITQKGKRLGLTLQWADIVSGESALAVALQASLGRIGSHSAPQPVRAGETGRAAPSDPKRRRGVGKVVSTKTRRR